MHTTDTGEGTASTTRTVTSLIGGNPQEDAPGGRMTSVNPARTSETVAEVLLGDANTFLEACGAARGAPDYRLGDGAPRSRLVTYVNRSPGWIALDSSMRVSRSS